MTTGATEVNVGGLAGDGERAAANTLPVPRPANVDMVPHFPSVVERVAEAPDVVTLEVAVPPALRAVTRFLPGQFVMLYAFGVGEIPIGLAGDPGVDDRLVFTVRAVGPVSRALASLRVGDTLGLRGPFGNHWPIEAAEGRDLLVVAGGIGLSPLRPLIYHALRHRGRYGRVVLLYGAKRREELLYRDELSAWRRRPDLELRVSLDRGDRDWSGHVGFVTQFLPALGLSPTETQAAVCGPEVMIRATGRALVDLGVPAERVHASLERNMKCALGTCGHCQLGALFLCRDGPVFTFRTIDPLMAIREL